MGESNKRIFECGDYLPFSSSFLVMMNILARGVLIIFIFQVILCYFKRKPQKEETCASSPFQLCPRHHEGEVASYFFFLVLTEYFLNLYNSFFLC